MKIQITLCICILSVYFFVACASHTQKNIAVAEHNLVEEKIWVAKADGSKQCGFEKGISPDEAAQELTKAGLKVFAKRKSTDGMMRVMMCGSATGDTVELQIPASQQKAAADHAYHLVNHTNN